MGHVPFSPVSILKILKVTALTLIYFFWLEPHPRVLVGSLTPLSFVTYSDEDKEHPR